MTELSSFHDELFPLAISFGATGGPEHRNEIVRMTSGTERRNARFAASRRRYDAGTGLASLEDLYEVLAFFEARRGSLHAFRFRDPFDMKSCRPEALPSASDQAIGIGDGVTRRFQLVKIYGSGPDAVSRVITKPVPNSVQLALDEAPAEAFSVDCLTGTVEFAAAPPEGAIVTAGFLFDVPVRFDCERLSVCLANFRAGRIPAVPLVEVAE